MTQKIREVMSSDPVTVQATTPIVQVAKTMRDEGIGDVIVMTDGKLCGIVTDRDVTVRATAEGRDPKSTPVSEICSQEIVSLSPDDRVERAVELMRERSVRRLPVVEGGRPVGVVTMGDLAIERDEKSALAQISAAAPNR
jgi:CBS domain-containing protein